MTESKIVLITGAGKGIGREFALHLASTGHTVVCCSRTQLDLDSLEADISTVGGTCTCFRVDVTDFQSLTEVRGKVQNLYGGLDCLVVNAGVDPENATVEDSAIEKWEEAIQVNLLGSYKTAKAFLPLLKRGGGGQIIMIGSGLGHRGLPKKTAYSVSKAGQWMLTRILAQELIDDNILVNEIIPGPVQTSIDREIREAKTSVSSIFTTEWNKEPKDLLPLLEFLLSQGKKGPTGQSFSLARRDLY